MLDINIDLKEWLNSIATKWPRRSSLLIALLLILLFLLWLFSDISIEKISLNEIIIILLSLSLLFLLWLYSTRVPKTSRGKVGFGVAISTETKEQREQLAKDFSLTLRELLYNSNLRYQFSFIELPQHHALRIKNGEDANHYLRLSRCHFLIYGRARVRQIDGKDRHVLNMEGIVAHRPVPQAVSKYLSVEFAELFPRKLQLLSENDLFLFEFTSQWVHLVARYIIGIASLISGDVEYSQELFENLREEVKQHKTELPAIAKVQRRLPLRLTEVYLVQARLNHTKWRQTRDIEHLNKMKFYLDRLEGLAPNDYTGHLLRAIWYFLANRDIAAAKREIRKCRGIKDATWRYSYAFLYAYEGNMKQAIRLYRSAFKSPCANSVHFEVEEFICWVLEQETDKVQLYFCLGFVNYHGKGDKVQALRDFEKFLETAPKEQFSEAAGIAKTYIEDINEQLECARS